ncbi:MAG: AAA family ATPase [Candidatus Micrarchaeota archaeon]
MTDYFGFRRDEPAIIAKEEVLMTSHLPDEMLYRDAELQATADAVKPLFKKRYPDNLFIHGKSGTGKTSCVKYIMRQLTEHSDNVLPVYVNCWENYTQLAVYNRIIEDMRLPLPRRGMATDEIFDRILQYVKNYSKPVLLILDELDGLRHPELLYAVSRANEKPGILFGIIAITNNSALLAGLDARVRGSLRFSEREFKPYSEDQIFGILRSRAEAGLVPGSWDEKLLRKIARGAKDGSARVALHQLWKAAKKAENRSQKKITIQDLEDVIAEEESSLRLQELNLSPEEQLIVGLLKNGQMRSSDLYDKFKKKIPKTKRQIRNYLERLEKKELIESEELEAEGMLRPRVFRLKS